MGIKAARLMRWQMELQTHASREGQTRPTPGQNDSNDILYENTRSAKNDY
jgi:hypothetical protein